MSTDLRELLRRAAPPGGPPDLSAIRRRARVGTLRAVIATALISAGVTSAIWIVWAGLPTDFGVEREGRSAVGSGDTGGGGNAAGLASPEERAATVAIAALHDAELQQPSGIYFDYGEVLGEADGWRAYFCLAPPSSGACDSETSDAALSVAAQGDVMVVTAASGELAPHAASLVGYSEPAAPPEPGHIWSFEEQTATARAAGYWTGAIPSRLQATCRLEAIDASGEVVYRGREFPDQAPAVEGARDGILLMELPPDLRADHFRMDCETYGGAPPHEGPEPPEGPGTVAAEGEIPAASKTEFAGQQWRVLAWSEEDRWCWGVARPASEGPATQCTPRALGVNEALSGWGYSSSRDGREAFAHGQLRADVARVEFHLWEGDLLVATMAMIIEPPAGMDIGSKYFVAFIPQLNEGELVARDAAGEVLARERVRVADSR